MVLIGKNIFIIAFLLLINSTLLAQIYKDYGELDIVFKNEIDSDSMFIYLFRDGQFLKRHHHLITNSYKEMVSVDIKKGIYDVLIIIPSYPYLFYKDVLIKKRKMTFLIIDVNNMDEQSLPLIIKVPSKTVQL